MTPKRAKTSLGSSKIFLTGGTGFLGQSILERLIVAHPDTRIVLMIRGKGSTSGTERLRTLLRKPVFRIWREAVGEDEVERVVRERIEVLDGSLSNFPDLPGDLDVVIHSASTVSFDPPIDQAFDTNVGGALGLYAALEKSGGDPHVVYVSTAYVGGLRKGIRPEARLEHSVDWRAEYDAAKSARERVEMESRQPEHLRRFLSNARARHGKEGPYAVSSMAEEARAEWVRSRLVEFGRLRAESLGWTDVYTLTKSFSERAAEEIWGGGGHRLSIVRPSIIESAFRDPYPGWIDGMKVADPLILAYGRGLLPEFPGLPDSILDVIPVDFVSNVILTVAANPPKAGAPEYFQVTSGASNPLPFHQMATFVNAYFKANPLPAAGTGHISVRMWRFPGGRKVEQGVRRRLRLVEASERLFERLPATARTRQWLATAARNRRDLGSLANFAQLYRAYVQTEIIFDDRNTKALHDALPAAARKTQGFDVRDIDWRHYFLDVHFPYLMEMTKAFSKRPAARERTEEPPLPTRSDVVAIFDLEGTVVDSNIVEQYLWVRSAGLGKAAWPGEVLSLLIALPRYLRADRRDRGEFIRLFLRRYAGMPVARLSRIVSGGYGDSLRRHTMADAVRRIREHKAAGHHVVLVTGSIGMLAEPISDLFDEIVAASMDERDGVLSGYLAKPPLVDEARAAWLQHWAADNKYDLAESYGYGDSHADVVWLNLVGHPAAVNPDTNLAKEALRRKWRIFDWK